MAEYAGSKWWSKDTVAVVTGSNRGIGYEILRQLAHAGVTVVLTDIAGVATMRDSVDALKAELKLRSQSGLDSGGVFCHQLDVRSEQSVEELATWLKKQFGEIDILVNNAGIQKKVMSYQAAKDTLDTNFWGPKRVTEALLPLMRKTSPGGARIVCVTSRLGSYERLKNESVKEKFSHVDHLSFQILDDIAHKYLQDVKDDRFEEEGWIPSPTLSFPAYSESKMLLSAYTEVLALSLLSDHVKPGPILVCAMSPGPTDTAMVDDETKNHLPSNGVELKTVEQGADTAVWLALLPKEGYPHGKFFSDRKEYPRSQHLYQ